jgi:hypothetical protein
MNSTLMAHAHSIVRRWRAAAERPRADIARARYGPHVPYRVLLAAAIRRAAAARRSWVTA